MNESKTLIKHISCSYRCKLDSKRCNSNNKNKNRYECKTPIKHWVRKKIYIWNPSKCDYK